MGGLDFWGGESERGGGGGGRGREKVAWVEALSGGGGGREGRGGALFVGIEKGSFLSSVSVFRLVLLQSRLVVVINLSEWGEVGGVFVGIIPKHP